MILSVAEHIITLEDVVRASFDNLASKCQTLIRGHQMRPICFGSQSLFAVEPSSAGRLAACRTLPRGSLLSGSIINLTEVQRTWCFFAFPPAADLLMNTTEQSDGRVSDLGPSTLIPKEGC
jgi:hypothetical protein